MRTKFLVAQSWYKVYSAQSKSAYKNTNPDLYPNPLTKNKILNLRLVINFSV
jgi:hypothetical protein